MFSRTDAVILVHNHPGGDPTPSRADIEMTRVIVEVAKPLGIAVHDHIIVGKEGHASLKGLRLIRPCVPGAAHEANSEPQLLRSLGTGRPFFYTRNWPRRRCFDFLQR